MSKKFYTFVGTMDNAVYHRYYDENKNEVCEKVEEYDYTMYVEHHSDHSGYKSLLGRNLKEFMFRTPQELSKFYRENKDMLSIHGNDSAVQQFIAKEYSYDVKQTCPVNILNFDLEVEHSQGFPDPQKGEQEILSVSVKKFGADEVMYSIGTKPLVEYDNPKGKYIQCKDEKEVIVQFLKIWKDINPQIVTGWNIDNFDIPYLVNRIKNVFGKKALAHLSPFKDKVKNNDKLITEKLVNDKIQYEIFGVTSYDYIELYQKYNLQKQESYKLDYIGEVEISQRKVNFDEYKKSLMNLYNGVITTDLKTPFTELDTIMKFARIREVARRRLAQVGYSIENDTKFLGDNVYSFELDSFDFQLIKDGDNDTLKGIYNYCDERVKTLSYKKFVMYNEQDANIVELIDNKKKYIKQAVRVAHMSRSRLKDIFGTVAPWDNMLYARLLAKGIQIPPRESFEKDEKFTGAYVKDPILGFHKWIVSFDYKSLYPSIIRLLKMSPESLIKGQDDNRMATLNKILNREYETDSIKEQGHGVAGNGSVFDQSVDGVLPETMEFLMEERDVVKDEMKDYKNYMQHLLKYVEYMDGQLSEFTKDKNYVKSYERHKDVFLSDEEIQKLDLKAIPKLISEIEDHIGMLDATQQALKILANSGYGAIGNIAFRYFRIDIAEAITLTGQLALRYVSAKVDEYLNKLCGTKDVVYAIYGDTDSIYVTLDNWVKYNKVDESDPNKVIDFMDDFVNKDLSPFICNTNEDLSDYIGAKENLLIMKREALGDSMIFRGKKNYIIQVYDNEFVRYSKPEIKMMGVETAKSSTAMIIRKKLEECFNIVINKDTHEPIELKSVVDDFRKEFDEVDIVSIASPRGIKDIDKWLDERGNILSGCPIHVRAAIVYNNFIASDPNLKRRYEEIKNGSKIRFVKLKQPNLLHSHVVAFVDDIPEEMELEKYVDRKTQFEDTFMKPLESFTQLIDWDVRRTNSLSSLFGDEEWGDQIQHEELEIKKEKQKSQPKKISVDSLFG